MTDMVEVMISSIRVSLMSQQRIVILREMKTERYLAIWIGPYEAEAITMALQEVEVERPLTWDLLKNIFNMINARLLRVEVVALRESTFFGNIVAEIDGRIMNIDSRPSDALALAVRTHVPIFVARGVLDEAGIIPEEDIKDKAPEQAEAEAKPAAGGEAGEDEDRLSIFEDFLDKLDLDDSTKKGDTEEDDKDKE